MKKIIQLVVFTLLCVLTTNAQNGADSNFVFVDFKPDSSLTGTFDTCKLDINKDGVIDIAFFYSRSSAVRFPHYTTYANVSRFQVDTDYSDSLSSPVIQWEQGQTPSYFFDISSYVCIKIIQNQQNYYGWVKISQFRTTDETGTSNNGISINEYAFCKIPNYPLTVGQKDTRTSIYELVGSTKSLNIFANPTQGLCTINLPIALSNSAMHLRLYNPLGQLVKETTLAAGLSSTELNLQAFSKGTYTVSISNGNTLYSGQVILE